MIPNDPLERLRDASYLKQHDPHGFYRLLERLPEQAREAWRLGLDCDLVPVTAGGRKRPHRVILAGVGGSAIGADVAATLAGLYSTTPVIVVRNYHLPPLDAGTVVIVSSFSGNTEEALTAFEAAADTAATTIAITTGGRLAERAEERGIATVRYEWPGPPRTGFGFGVFLPLALLRRLDVLAAIPDDEFDGAFATLERCVEAWGPRAPGNEAQDLAAWLLDSVVAIVGADMLEVAARRWAGELAENAKQLAAAYGIPEFNHNQMEPAATTGPVPGDVRFVLLDAPPVHPRNRLRVGQTALLLGAAGRHVRVVDAGGERPLEAILAACSLGSWTSYYLSVLRGVDPALLTVMEQLKERMADEL